MAAPIDYSKWDHIIIDDDDDESSSEPMMMAPRVTRLDAPSRITRTAEGWSVVPQPSSAPAKESSKQTTSTTTIPRSWTEKGSHCCCCNNCCESGPFELYWSQDRYTVTFRIAVPAQYTSTTTTTTTTTTRGWKCAVTNILPFQDRFSAVGIESRKQQLVIQDNLHRTLFQGDLTHPAHLDQDDDDDEADCIDWNIEYDTAQKRYICITLKKAVPMQGMTLWWKKPFAHCQQEIEINWRKDSDQIKSFQEAWDAAHETFLRQADKNKSI